MRISVADKDYNSPAKRDLRPFIAGHEITYAVAAQSGPRGWVDRFVTEYANGRERVAFFRDEPQVRHELIRGHVRLHKES